MAVGRGSCRGVRGYRHGIKDGGSLMVSGDSSFASWTQNPQVGRWGFSHLPSPVLIPGDPTQGRLGHSALPPPS